MRGGGECIQDAPHLTHFSGCDFNHWELQNLAIYTVERGRSNVRQIYMEGGEVVHILKVIT